MKKHQGFTLLELIVVMFIMALLVGVMAPSFSLSSDTDRVEKASQRFKAIFDLASEYAMLNNHELGIIFKDDNYRFVAFDGQRWIDFTAERYFEPSEHEEDIELELELEGLEWSEGNLLNEVTFEVEEDDENEDKEMLSPQVFILSSGDITPFRLTFTIEPEFRDPIHFQVTGDFTAPVKLEGPLEELPE